MRPKLVPELLVRDLAASLRFYVDALGFRVLYDRPEEGFAYLERNGAELMLDRIGPGSWTPAPLEPPLGRGVNFQIEVEDAAALRARLAGPVFLELETVWYRAGDRHLGVRQFIAQDPDGYLIRLQQPIGARDDLPPETKRPPDPNPYTNAH